MPVRHNEPDHESSQSMVPTKHPTKMGEGEKIMFHYCNSVQVIIILCLNYHSIKL